MIELIEANWLAFLLAAVMALLVAYWIVRRDRVPRERSHRPDVLDEGVGPAKRNQALIDAAPAASPAADSRRADEPVPTPEVLAGTGTAIAAAALANEPGVDEDIATRRDADHAAMPAKDTAIGTGPANGPPQADAEATPTTPPPTTPTPEVSAREKTASAVKIASEGNAVDDLRQMKGVGPKLIAMLGSMGISRFDQIAAWSDEDVQRIDAQLGNFRGRIERDDWREQARLLAAGDRPGYEEKFGRL